MYSLVSESSICLDKEIQVHLHGRSGIYIVPPAWIKKSCPPSGAGIQFNLHGFRTEGFRPDLLGKKGQRLVYMEPTCLD
jgi:hypothetical protein